MLRSQANWEFTYNDKLSETDLFQQLSLSSLTKRLLIQRGITTVEQAESFLNPKLDELIQPSLMKDMEKAARRIQKAIDNEESILVFGDYDADGVSSTSVLVQALRELGAMCEFYIPNRFTEGYGPNEEAFKEAHKQGFQLIITVDTGIAAVHEAAVAKQLGIDLIITDHHEVQETVPDAYAIIHPKCSPDYSFKELAGVGVAFKLAQHLLGYFPSHLLDLVVIGTIADLVSLTEENRTLAYYGLKAITNSKRPGIQALKRQCNIEGDVTEEDIGFLIGPRINAVGRLQDAHPAVDLLLTDDPEEAEELAAFIQQLNQERKQIVSDIAKEAEAMVESGQSGVSDQVIVVAKEGWNEGVLGIVASKLVRSYQRPAIVLSINKDKGHAKGSARSVDAFDLFSNCMKMRDTFTHFGGHAQAAGMTLPEENINQLRERLNQLAEEQLTVDDYKELLSIDSTVDIEELDVSLINEFGKLAPFGMDNPKPIFHIRSSVKELRQIGSMKNHLKISFQEGQSQLDSIAFGMGDIYPMISPHAVIDAIGELQINEWNGKRKVQLLVKDIAVTEWQLFDYRGSKYWHKQLSSSMFENSIAISFNDQTIAELPREMNYYLYNHETISDLSKKKVKDLFLLDLPNSFEELSEVLSLTKPERIYACYQVDDGQYFTGIPTREDFKWFYAMILKRKKFDSKTDIPKLTRYKGWKAEKIKLMIQVFCELDFVKIENGIISPQPNPLKKDLTQSPMYQRITNQSEIESVLYYSNFKELKNWISEQMIEVSVPKEEVSYGL